MERECIIRVRANEFSYFECGTINQSYYWFWGDPKDCPHTSPFLRRSAHQGRHITFHNVIKSQNDTHTYHTIHIYTKYTLKSTYLDISTLFAPIQYSIIKILLKYLTWLAECSNSTVLKTSRIDTSIQ